MADQVPVVSQIKSAVQFLFNDPEGALQTQINFSKRCIVVSQVRSYVEVITGQEQNALETQKEFLTHFEKTFNNVPVVGHFKGIFHYIDGDTQKGNDAMKGATRTLGAIAGGVLGMVAGGPPGAVACGTAGATVVDGVITGIESAAKGKLRPNGLLKGVSDIYDYPTDAGLWFDTGFTVYTDGTTGLEYAEKAQKKL